MFALLLPSGWALDKLRCHAIVCNADMRVGEIRQFCRLPDEEQSLMRAAMTQLNLSARAYHRILKLARTITDLAGVLHASQPAEIDARVTVVVSTEKKWAIPASVADSSVVPVDEE